MKFWYAYVSVFLSVWLVLMFGFGLFPDVIRQWPMALVMILGSLVAGSTPMGGGVISFPFLVLWFGVPPDSARDFGLMMQGLGMTSAMIFIFCRRVPVQGRMLVWTIVGAAAGMFLGTFAIAPHIAANFVKLTFACLWMSFAILTMAKLREFCRFKGVRSIPTRTALRTGLLVGLIGGCIASVIGVGVEMVFYTTLVLLYRCDLEIAIPSAVSAMAVTSVIGVGARLLVSHISRDIVMKFLAAGPIAIFGAAIGAYLVSIVPRSRTLYVISFLCVLQFAWILIRLQRTAAEWTFVAIAIASATAMFYWMYRRGESTA